MGSIRKRSDGEGLFLDFRYLGKRCREQTALPDTASNRAKLQKLLDRIEYEIRTGTFDYARTFPGSRMAAKVVADSQTAPVVANPIASAIAASAVASLPAAVAHAPRGARPRLAEFAALWVAESEIGWRRSHRRTVGDIIDRHLLPAFGERVVDDITKADILSFRSTLAKVPGRKGQTLSAKRINAIIGLLRQILNEAADRFDFSTPYRNIRPLRQVRPDVEPFTFDEVARLLASVRADFRSYYTVRFFTGMRTGEIDGLKWQYVDFERRQILIRETLIMGEEDGTKTEGSRREIQMSQVVFDALHEQARATRPLSPYVFCSREGRPLDHNNVTKRVWYPLLRHLGLKARRPYQSRHTAATLWLAAGENPLWIARQLGHASTEMLFKVYGRFVPNLTRQDGSAFERLLLQRGAASIHTGPPDARLPGVDAAGTSRPEASGPEANASRPTVAHRNPLTHAAAPARAAATDPTPFQGAHHG